jgi:GNAT superfamily N-acetyltransferase
LNRAEPVEPDPARPGVSRRVLRDGTVVVVRPLVPEDRAELIERYAQLSPASRRLRFVSAPEHLSERLLDHLLDVDQHDRVAIVAAMADEPGAPGVGIARYARLRGDPTTAEAAVTVLDPYQGRGIGTLLLTELVSMALERGVDTFVADVMWDNHELLDGLRGAGAVVTPGEPGSASVRVDLPSTPDQLERSQVYQVMRTVGSA